MSIDDVFAHKKRIEIIKFLHEKGETLQAKIFKELNMNHKQGTKHLKTLEEYGMVNERILGGKNGIHLWNINSLNHKITILRDLLRKWEKKNYE